MRVSPKYPPEPKKVIGEGPRWYEQRQSKGQKDRQR